MATGTKYSSTVQRVVAHFQPSINLDGLNSGLDDFADRSISMLFSISLVGNGMDDRFICGGSRVSPSSCKQIFFGARFAYVIDFSLRRISRCPAGCEME